jgi:hypothetical protein
MAEQISRHDTICIEGTYLSYIIDIIVIYLLLNVCFLHVKGRELVYAEPVLLNPIHMQF